MTIHCEFVRETNVIKIGRRKGNWNVRCKTQGQVLNTNSVLKNIKNHVDLNKYRLSGVDAPLIIIDCGMLVQKQCSRRYDKAISGAYVGSVNWNPMFRYIPDNVRKTNK